MSESLVTVDVREDIRAGREPFGRIMGTVADLGIGQALLLIAPFEPVPLYGILEQRGFTHESRATKAGHWEVLFSRDSGAVSPSTNDHGPVAKEHLSSSSAASACAGRSGSIIEVDARGLEPPQPLVTILEALSSLPEGAGLRAHTDRRPMHLYAQLEQRGFTSETETDEDGSFLTLIRRSARP